MYKIDRLYEIKYDYRYFCKVLFSPAITFGKVTNPWMKCIIDTGAFNTLIPLKYAKLLGGKRLNIMLNTVIAGRSHPTTGYLFKNIMIGGYKISHLIAFASEFEGVLKDMLLLGANVLFNWKLTLSGNMMQLEFVEDTYKNVKNIKYPYCTYYNASKQLIQDYSLIEEVEETQPTFTKSTVFT